MDAVRAAVEERDLLLLLADAARPIGKDDRQALDLARKCHAPVVLVLNKIDLVKDKALLLPLIDQYRAAFEFADYVPVSATKGQGLDELKKVILHHLPEGPEYFPRTTLPTSRSGFWPPN